MNASFNKSGIAIGKTSTPNVAVVGGAAVSRSTGDTLALNSANLLGLGGIEEEDNDDAVPLSSEPVVETDAVSLNATNTSALAVAHHDQRRTSQVVEQAVAAFAADQGRVQPVAVASPLGHNGGGGARRTSVVSTSGEPNMIRRTSMTGSVVPGSGRRGSIASGAIELGSTTALHRASVAISVTPSNAAALDFYQKQRHIQGYFETRGN